MFSIPGRFAGIRRFERILRVLTAHGLGFTLEKMKLKRKSLIPQKRINHPAEVRQVFEELGGTFIKLGQFLSMRPDLIPKEYCDELAKLQDSVQPFSYDEAEHIIRAELGKPAKSLFRSFDRTPIAAASIGQVHVAHLKDGKKVAVKVMRPGIKAVFETDLEILDYLARLAKHHIDPVLFDPVEIFDEFKHYTEGELDYMKELRNIKSFYEDFNGSKDVKIPRPYESLSAKRVLTMEYIEGVSLRKIISGRSCVNLDRKKLAQKIAESFLRQIFVEGLFHADPHPGNIFVMRDRRIALLDFGIAGRLDREMKDKLTNLLIGVMEKDVDALVSALMSLNIVDTAVDSLGLKQELTEELAEYYDVSLDKMDLGEIFVKLIALAKRYNIRISRDFVLLGKSLITQSIP